VWVLRGINLQVFWGYKFHTKKYSGNLSVGAKMWDTACCYELILLAEIRQNVGTFVNTVMNLVVP
jgi:hypothetical protein